MNFVRELDRLFPELEQLCLLLNVTNLHFKEIMSRKDYDLLESIDHSLDALEEKQTRVYQQLCQLEPIVDTALAYSGALRSGDPDEYTWTRFLKNRLAGLMCLGIEIVSYDIEDLGGFASELDQDFLVISSHIQREFAYVRAFVFKFSHDEEKMEYMNSMSGHCAEVCDAEKSTKKIRPYRPAIERVAVALFIDQWENGAHLPLNAFCTEFCRTNEHSRIAPKTLYDNIRANREKWDPEGMYK